MSSPWNSPTDPRLRSLSNDLHQHPLPPSPVEFGVEDLLPRAEIQLAVRDRDDDLPAHDLALEVGVGVVLARAVVAVLARRLVRGELFEPLVVILDQAGLVVVDVHRGRDVHGVDEDEAVLDRKSTRLNSSHLVISYA